MRTERLNGLAEALTEMISTEITFGEPVEPETDLLLTGLVDSIGVVRIVTWMEDHLEIEIDPVDVVLEKFQTVALMVGYAQRC
jgi:acyl carrier protein